VVPRRLTLRGAASTASCQHLEATCPCAR
jgi:hypothetical protein